MDQDVVLLPGSWRLTDAEPVLLGSQCGTCGKYFFPRQATCTECALPTAMNHVELSRRGRLYSYSIVHTGARGFRTPYTIGYVDLPEGVRVFAHLESTEDLQLDTEVELTWGDVGENEEGRPMLAFKFRSA